jgi:hypothetical protein
MTTKPTKPTSGRNIDNCVGATINGIDYVVDLDELTADLLRECDDTTGRSEVQIVVDLNSRPGRLSLANFVWLATRAAGKWISYDDAFALASPTAMRTAKALIGPALAKAVEKAGEAHPQT